ncbi:TPA: GNAT family N-acetyltransferase [Streptococcus suis]|uniref:GNAT family N-acetyltransferase n=1 Tax=Streptococcus suis TaxID=1307 RepID=UPI001C951608|nr:GNAT family N-acetyltransferase [Streptococcus suis]MBY5022807.1 GNAT family N-acetyltransferase [Streptococcus suis]
MTKPNFLFSSTEDLLAKQVQAIKDLFDREYRDGYGEWNLKQPYGYAPQDYHLLAYQGEDLVGHMGSQVRTISVGAEESLIAGIGGVLIAPEFRGKGLGRAMMTRLLEENTQTLAVDFSYLGCREEVVPYYEACGFYRMERLERSINRLTNMSQEELSIVMIASGQKNWRNFPSGRIDLHGRPW